MPGRSCLVNGAYGVFEGDAEDRVVLGRYREQQTWSPALVELIADRLLQRGRGTLIDVGAHIGLVTIPVLARSRARGFAFEPEPHNHGCLVRNLARHGLESRVRVHELALDSHNGRTWLALSPDNSGDHRLTPAEGPSDRARIEVPTARLDDLVTDAELEAPVVMKLDSQGAEARVLRGAARVVRRLDYLVVEYWPAGLLRAGDSAEALQQLLLQFPYCALLGYQSLDGALRSPAELFAQMAFVPTDGSDEGFFDILLSRHERVPDSIT